MPSGFLSLTAKPETIRLMSDKQLLTLHLVENDFSKFFPSVYEESGNLAFPYLIKCRTLNGGQGVRIIHNNEELVKTLSDSIFRDNYFFQELIRSEFEYVCHIVASRGVVLFETTYRYSMPNAATVRGPKSHVSMARVENSNEARDVFAKIIKHLNYSGPCNIDFKLINGLPIIFEINPRLGGSLMMSQNVSDLARTLGSIINNAR